MANNSATGGYLLPLQASPPLEDAELEAVFQGYIAGVSGLPSNLVRTRWPAAGAEPPAPDQTWCLMDIRSQAADAAPAVTHDPAGEGTDSPCSAREHRSAVLDDRRARARRSCATARPCRRTAKPAGAGHGGDRRGAHPGQARTSESAVDSAVRHQPALRAQSEARLSGPESSVGASHDACRVRVVDGFRQPPCRLRDLPPWLMDCRYRA